MSQLSSKIDQLYTLRQRRLAEQKKVDELKDEEDRILAWIQDAMETQSVDTIGGSLAIATLKHKRKPEVLDWAVLYQHIIATGQVELLQARLKESSVAERWQMGQEVPGVASRDVVEVGITKVKA